MLSYVYGSPPGELAAVARDAVQVSPLVPDATSLEDIAPATADGVTIAAPAGTLERRYVVGLALRALKVGAPLTVLAPNEKGGTRLAKELTAFDCEVSAESKRHHRICRTVRPTALNDAAVATAIEQGQPRFSDDLGQWTQPGVFSWDRHDVGSLLLMSVLPALSGQGADLGCGIGLLAAAVLANPDVTHLDLVEIDRRAIAAARRNITDKRAAFHWADARVAPVLGGLDFVVMNPPFHDAGIEDKGLGQAFVRRARQILRPGGTLWVVANRHLPYEGIMSSLFTTADLRAEGHGFKVYEARA